VAQEPQRQAEPAKEQVVKYEATGGTHNFHAREITTAQWKKAGVEDQKTVRWDLSNNFQVPVSDLNDAALRLLEQDDELNVREV
jgi:hypothetical protein